MAYADLYLAKDKTPKIIEQKGRPTKGTPMGDAMLRLCTIEEQNLKDKEEVKLHSKLKVSNGIKSETLKQFDLDKKLEQQKKAQNDGAKKS